MTTSVGNWLFVASEEDVWVGGRVKKVVRNEVTIEDENGKLHTSEETLAGSEACINVLLPDLVALPLFHDASVLHQLRARFTSDKVYTWIGDILVAINPYKTLSSYTQDILNDYVTSQPRHMTSQVPHVYACAASAYRELIKAKENQAFVISGQSGAGKTETTKIVLQYLATVAKSGSTDRNNSCLLQQKILQSNPLLEAFGNAKTIRNDNSSRFGKWVEIMFDTKSETTVTGARIVQYLLEKSRVVSVSQGERGYHIFYQLCAACDEDATMKDQFQLESAEEYRFLNTSNIFDIEHHSNYEDFITTHAALQSIASKEEVTSLLSIIAGILQLGNITFHSDDTTGADITIIDNEDQVTLAAKNLGVEPHFLCEMLTTKMLGIGSIQRIPIRFAEAMETRNSLCQNMYSMVFDWLVDRINSQLSDSDKLISPESRFIGVLDIFGFEIFDTNSFEQFCINFANEKLQYHFTEYILRMDQLVYAQEGIKVSFVDFDDNLAAISDIEGKSGILMLLEEECRIPNGDDKMLLGKLDNAFESSSKSKFGYHAYGKLNGFFQIHHYAGYVLYDIDGFVAKNKERLQSSLVSSMTASENMLIKDLFTKQFNSEYAVPEDSGGRSRTLNATVRGNQHRGIGYQFKMSLGVLLQKLKSASPYFIRCLKPNTVKKAGMFESDMVLHQMKYSGLFEAIRVRTAGYAFRIPFKAFHEEFKKCVNTRTMDAMGLLKELVTANPSLSAIQKGSTRMFLRAEQMDQLYELKAGLAGSLVKIVQTNLRTWKAVCEIRRVKALVEQSETLCTSEDMGMIQNLLQTSAKELPVLLVSKLKDRVLNLKSERELVVALESAMTSNDPDTLHRVLVQAQQLKASIGRFCESTTMLCDRANEQLQDLGIPDYPDSTANATVHLPKAPPVSRIDELKFLISDLTKQLKDAQDELNILQGEHAPEIESIPGPPPEPKLDPKKAKSPSVPPPKAKRRSLRSTTKDRRGTANPDTFVPIPMTEQEQKEAQSTVKSLVDNDLPDGLRMEANPLLKTQVNPLFGKAEPQKAKRQSSAGRSSRSSRVPKSPNSPPPPLTAMAPISSAPPPSAPAAPPAPAAPSAPSAPVALSKPKASSNPKVMSVAQNSSVSSPPPAPAAPKAPAAPSAPKVVSSLAVSSAPMPKPAAGLSLMDQIRAGKELKAAEKTPEQKEQIKPKDPLLEELSRRQKKISEQTPAELKPKPAPVKQPVKPKAGVTSQRQVPRSPPISPPIVPKSNAAPPSVKVTSPSPPSDSLMDQIKAGKGLKSTPVVQKTPAPANDLLSELSSRQKSKVKTPSVRKERHVVSPTRGVITSPPARGLGGKTTATTPDFNAPPPVPPPPSVSGVVSPPPPPVAPKAPVVQSVSSSAPPPAKVDLLAEIRAGKTLKKASVAPKKPKPAKANPLMDELARHKTPKSAAATKKHSPITPPIPQPAAPMDPPKKEKSRSNSGRSRLPSTFKTPLRKPEVAPEPAMKPPKSLSRLEQLNAALKRKNRTPTAVLDDLKCALQELDKAKLQTLLEEVQRLGLQSDDVKEAKRVVYGVSTSDLATEVLGKAIEAKDTHLMQTGLKIARNAPRVSNLLVVEATNLLSEDLSRSRASTLGILDYTPFRDYTAQFEKCRGTFPATAFTPLNSDAVFQYQNVSFQFSTHVDIY